MCDQLFLQDLQSSMRYVHHINQWQHGFTAFIHTPSTAIPWWQGSCGQHGAHLGPTGPMWAPYWPHELCYLGSLHPCTEIQPHYVATNHVYEISTNKSHWRAKYGKTFEFESDFILAKEAFYSVILRYALQWHTDIEYNAWVSVNNDSLATSEVFCQWFWWMMKSRMKIHWQITSPATKKSLFTVTNVLFYFLHAILCSEHTIPLKTIINHSFHHSRQNGLYRLIIHHSWSLKSCKLALWRHIHRLFFHVQIGTKAIFTSE